MEKYKGRVVVADIWPLLPTMVKENADSAWPHMAGPNGPLLVYFMWEGSENDAVWIKQMKTALDHIRQIAIEEKCTTQDAPVYCNTALDHDGYTTVEKIYRNNLGDLRALRKILDPDRVMDSRRISCPNWSCDTLWVLHDKKWRSYHRCGRASWSPWTVHKRF